MAIEEVNDYEFVLAQFLTSLIKTGTMGAIKAGEIYRGYEHMVKKGYSVGERTTWLINALPKDVRKFVPLPNGGIGV